MIDNFAHGLRSGGVTSVHVARPSVVAWMRPSSVPIKMRFASLYDGAIA